MVDQYGNQVPDDLVVLDFPVVPDPAIVRAVEAIDWYESEDNPRIVLASWAAVETALGGSLGAFDPTECDDAGVDPSRGVTYVNRVLHRHEIVGSGRRARVVFYHA